MNALPNIPWIGPMRARSFDDPTIERVAALLSPEHGVRSQARPDPRGRAVLGLAFVAVGALLLHDSALRGFLRAPAIPVAGEAGDSEMSRSRSLMAGVLGAGMVASVVVAQQAVPWRVEDGGNGHWYGGAKLSTTKPVEWEYARAFAVSHGADLACLNSAAELAWVFDNIADSPELWSMSFGPWIGAYQSQGAAHPDSDWFWIDGSTLQSGFPWTYLQPDDARSCGGHEDYVCYWFGEGVPTPVNRFADMIQDGYCPNRPEQDWVTSAILEWSADCNEDGVVDFGQISTGELLDLDGNNIPDCCEQGVRCGCAADIDGNGAVNGVDLAIVLTKWGTNGGKDYPDADIDRSGVVDGADLAQILGDWGSCQ